MKKGKSTFLKILSPIIALALIFCIVPIPKPGNDTKAFDMITAPTRDSSNSYGWWNYTLEPNYVGETSAGQAHYQVYEAEQLAWISVHYWDFENAEIELMNDIDISGLDQVGEYMEWIPIHEFSGIFEGNDYSIIGMTINDAYYYHMNGDPVSDFYLTYVDLQEYSGYEEVQTEINMGITAPPYERVGFFRSLSGPSQGASLVRNLTFEDAEVFIAHDDSEENGQGGIYLGSSASILTATVLGDDLVRIANVKFINCRAVNEILNGVSNLRTFNSAALLVGIFSGPMRASAADVVIFFCKFEEPFQAQILGYSGQPRWTSVYIGRSPLVEAGLNPKVNFMVCWIKEGFITEVQTKDYAVKFANCMLDGMCLLFVNVGTVISSTSNATAGTVVAEGLYYNKTDTYGLTYLWAVDPDINGGLAFLTYFYWEYAT